MKQRFCIIALFAILLAGSFSSCNDTKTYAEELADENASIKSFMALRHYTVSPTIPTAINEKGEWSENVFYKTESGMYIHVVDKGKNFMDTIPVRTPICVRYNEYYMTDSTGYSNMYSSNDPIEILYNKVSSSATYGDCLAWHEALDYVGYDGGLVYIIAPSKVGWSAYSSDVTAAFYELLYAPSQQ